MTPALTIVVPVFNRADIVTRTLDSVWAQTCRPLRLVLVDNASTDSSLSVITNWADAHRSAGFEIVIIGEPTPGATAARNRGLQEVGTEWTMFFDSDDTMQPDHVSRALACADMNPEADIIGWDVTMHDLDGSASVKPFEIEPPIMHCVMHGSMATQRYMVRTGLVRRIGGWDPQIMAWNDIELGTRLLRATDRVVKLHGQPTVDIYAQTVSITGTGYADRADHLCLSIDRMQQNLGPEYSAIINLKRAILAALCRREGDRAAANRILARALGDTPGALHRFRLRLAYLYTSIGGRGITRLLAPISPDLRK